MRQNIFILYLILYCFVCLDACISSPAQTKSEEILLELKDLAPLPKVHYYWPIDNELLLDSNNPKLYHIARTTHSVCFRGEKATLDLVKNAVYTCARINKTEPNIPCSIGINYGPWQTWYPALFPKDLPPTNRGEDFKAELKLFADRLNQQKQWVSEYNTFYGSSVKVTAILLDVERFHIKKNDDRWNEGMKELLDMTHQTAAQIFPDARIEWYGRGIQWDKVTTGWTGKEKYIPSLSCSLYSLPKTEDMDRWFRRTCELADTMDVEDITPWVALGSGYQYAKGAKLKWDPNWQYDPKYAYQWGKKLNLRTDPFYKRAKIIVFYPEPFNARAEDWLKHYIEYCRGAQEANG